MTLSSCRRYVIFRYAGLVALLVSLSGLLGPGPAAAQTLTTFVVDEGANALVRYDNSFMEPAVQVVGPAEAGRPARIALDPLNGWVYWSDAGPSDSDGRILRARRSGSAVETVISGYDNPAGLAIDPAGNALYWTDSNTDTIYRSDLDGSNTEVLVSASPAVDAPVEIQLDLQNGTLYWANGGDPDHSNGSIAAANLDGSAPAVVVDNLANPIGLALDVDGDRIYWAERGARTISRAALDGSSVELLVSDATAPIDVAPLGLTIDVSAQKLYWTTGARNGGSSIPGQIARADLSGDNVESVVTTGLDFPIGIALNPGAPLPVELTAFEGRVDRSTVLLQWATASEQQNAGFNVQHYRDGGFVTVGWVEGAGTTAAPQRYTHRIEGLAAGAHRFRLEQVDLDGTTAYSPEVEVVVEAPPRLTLHAPYPNPARGPLSVAFELPRAAEVQLGVYDVLGRRVQYQTMPSAPAGTHTLTIDTEGLPSGLYLVRLSALGQSQTTKVSVMR